MTANRIILAAVLPGLLAAGCTAGVTLHGEKHKVQIGNPAPFVKDPIAYGDVPRGAYVVARADGKYTYVATAAGTIYLFDEDTGRVPAHFGMSAGDRLILEHTSSGISWTHVTALMSGSGASAPFGGPFRLYFMPELPTTQGVRG